MTKEGKSGFENVQHKGFLFGLVVEISVGDGVWVVDVHDGAKVTAVGCIEWAKLVIGCWEGREVISEYWLDARVV